MNSATVWIFDIWDWSNWLPFGTKFNLQVPVEILEGGQIPSLDPKCPLLQERLGTWDRGQMPPLRTPVGGGGHTSPSGPRTSLGVGTQSPRRPLGWRSTSSLSRDHHHCIRMLMLLAEAHSWRFISSPGSRNHILAPERWNLTWFVLQVVTLGFRVESFHQRDRSPGIKAHNSSQPQGRMRQQH